MVTVYIVRIVYGVSDPYADDGIAGVTFNYGPFTEHAAAADFATDSVPGITGWVQTSAEVGNAQRASGENLKFGGGDVWEVSVLALPLEKPINLTWW